MTTSEPLPQDSPEDQPMPDPGVAERTHPDPVAVGPGDLPGTAAPGEAHHPAAAGAAHGPATPSTGSTNGAAEDAADASLLALVDRLTAVLERTELAELEVSAGGTTIILRSPAALERGVTVAAAPTLDLGAQPGEVPGQPAAPTTPAATIPAPAKPSVKAPLTGIFYGAPSPGATPYVAIGDHVSVGQIIGLIEAMKLFNEIKSDLSGRVVRVCADNGALVKARQPLIEVEPA
jgi:acetyl-CoA carboxylase biotin carboxyl carrier protein